MRIILSLFFSFIAAYASSQPCTQQVVASIPQSYICGGIPLSLIATYIPGAAYNWTGPAGFTSNQQYPTVVNPVSGDYIVTVTAGSCIYKDTFHADVISVPKPIVSKSSLFKMNFVNPFCINDELTFQALNTTNIDSITFTTPSSTTTTGIINFHIASIQTGNYIMMYQGEKGCRSAPDTTAVVTVPELHPVVTVTGNPNVKPYTSTSFTTTVTNGPSQPDLQWFKNGLELQNCTTSTLTVIPGMNVADNDQLFVTLKGDITDCLDSALSNTLTIHIDLGVNQFYDVAHISVYPNPTQQTLFIQTKPLERPLQAYLTDMNGRRVYSRQLYSNSKHAVDVQDMPPGLYMLEVWEDGKRVQVYKVVH